MSLVWHHNHRPNRCGERAVGSEGRGMSTTTQPSATPHRIADYEIDRWTSANQVSTVGSYLMAVSVLIFLWNVLVSIRRGPPSSRDASQLTSPA